jgi:hypothetical protein
MHLGRIEFVIVLFTDCVRFRLLSTFHLLHAVAFSYGQTSVSVRLELSTLLLVRTLRRTFLVPSGRAFRAV